MKNDQRFIITDIIFEAIEEVFDYFVTFFDTWIKKFRKK